MLLPVPALPRNSFTRERERKEDFQWVPIVCVCHIFSFPFVGRRARLPLSPRRGGPGCACNFWLGSHSPQSILPDPLPGVFYLFLISFLFSFSGYQKSTLARIHTHTRTSSTCFGRNGVPAVGASVANNKLSTTTTTTTTTVYTQ